MCAQSRTHSDQANNAWPLSSALAAQNQTMKIDIEINTAEIEVNDYTIRDLLIDNDDKGLKNIRTKQFQALVAMPKKRFSNLNLTLSYYDEDNKFLGLDEDSIRLDDEDNRQKIPVSMPLNMPEGAAYSVFNIKASRIGNGFYYWAWRVGTITLILILVTWLIDNIMSLI